MRLAPGEHRVAVRIRDRRAVQLVRRAGVELEIARARRGIRARLRKRLAAVARLDQRELVGMGGDRLGDLRERAAADRRRELSKGAVARPRGRPHGVVDIRGTAASDGRERTAVGRIEHRQRAAVVCGDEPVGDEMLRRHRDGRPAAIRRVHRGQRRSGALIK